MRTRMCVLERLWVYVCVSAYVWRGGHGLGEIGSRTQTGGVIVAESGRSDSPERSHNLRCSQIYYTI